MAVGSAGYQVRDKYPKGSCLLDRHRSGALFVPGVFQKKKVITATVVYNISELGTPTNLFLFLAELQR